MAAKAGAIVIDNSSAWRMDPDVPLVVPEVNADALKKIPKGIVANPNCSTIQMVVALKPLHDLARIKRVVVATYQASSGKGAKATAELAAQLHALGHGEKVPPVTVHAAQLAGNVLPHDWKLGEDGYSEEEIKMIKETKKIMGDDTIQVSPTTVRVPVRIGHSEAINLEFDRPITPEQARAALRKAPGVIVLDDYAKGEVPLALHCEGRDEVFVGRIRRDPTVPHGLEPVGGGRQSPQRGGDQRGADRGGAGGTRLAAEVGDASPGDSKFPNSHRVAPGEAEPCPFSITFILRSRGADTGNRSMPRGRPPLPMPSIRTGCPKATSPRK